MMGVQNKWELLTTAERKRKDDIVLKRWLVSFLPNTLNADKYTEVSAPTEKKARKIARNRFGKDVACIYVHNTQNEYILKHNFKKEKLLASINAREL